MKKQTINNNNTKLRDMPINTNIAVQSKNTELTFNKKAKESQAKFHVTMTNIKNLAFSLKIGEYNVKGYMNYTMKKQIAVDIFKYTKKHVSHISLFSFMSSFCWNIALFMDLHTREILNTKNHMFQLRCALFFSVMSDNKSTHLNVPMWHKLGFDILNKSNIPFHSINMLNHANQPLPPINVDPTTNKKVLSEFGKKMVFQINNSCISLRDITRSLLPLLSTETYSTFKVTNFPTEDSSPFFLTDGNFLEFLYRRFILNELTLPTPYFNDSQNKQITGYLVDLRLIIDFIIHYNIHDTFAEIMGLCTSNYINFSYKKLSNSQGFSNNNFTFIVLLLENFIKYLYTKALAEIIQRHHGDIVDLIQSAAVPLNTEQSQIEKPKKISKFKKKSCK